MAIFSLYLMWKSAELPIGWEHRRGPGGGAFPFWLSLGMLICCAVIFYRGLRGKTPESQSDESFMDRVSLRLFLTSIGSLGLMLSVPKAEDCRRHRLSVQSHADRHCCGNACDNEY